MHEVVFSGVRQKTKAVKTLDVAKRLIDYGFHPPTVYFPLIVDEATAARKPVLRWQARGQGGDE